MQNDYVAPIDHSAGSAAASTISGAAGGALSGGVKVGAGWLVSAIALGATVGLALSTGGGSLLASGALWSALAGGAAGAAVGFSALPLMATVGALFGGAKGASRAANEVKMERGAATELGAQVQAYRAQAVAQAQQASNDNKYVLPAQGSPMNPAMAQIDASSAQGLGTVTGQQLQRA